ADRNADRLQRRLHRDGPGARRLRARRARHRLPARGVLVRLGQPARLRRRPDQHGRDRRRHPQHLLPHADAAGDDGRRAGLRLRRPVHPGPGGVRAAGDRGLPRRAVHRPARPHPRGRRHLPAGVAPGEGAVRRQALHPAAGRRARRQRARQAAEADQPPGPGPDPDRAGRAGTEERRAGGGDRRGLGAGLLLPGAGPGDLRRVARRGRRQAGPRARAAADRRRHPGRDHRGRRGRGPGAGPGPRPPGALHRRHGRPRQELLQRRHRAVRLRRRGRRGAGALPRRPPGRGRRRAAGRAGPRGVAGRAAGRGRGAGRRLRRGGRHHAERAATGRHPRAAGTGCRAVEGAQPV
ncbi:MAG: N5,N10-methylenetetrahydromethanopterin reductase-related protein, partial [uncultured Corynebacteriales bacterium]